VGFRVAGKLTSDDRWGIYDLFAHYARYFDTANVDAFVQLWVPNGAYVLPGGRRWEGHDAIRKGFTAIATKPMPEAMKAKHGDTPYFQTSRQHHVGEMIFEGDTERCVVESYCNGMKHTPDDTFVVFVGHYRDTVVKVGDKWLFEERIFSDWEGDIVNGYLRANPPA
jgi:hypothetical protein